MLVGREDIFGVGRGGRGEGEGEEWQKRGVHTARLSRLLVNGTKRKVRSGSGDLYVAMLVRCKAWNSSRKIRLVTGFAQALWSSTRLAPPTVVAIVFCSQPEGPGAAADLRGHVSTLTRARQRQIIAVFTPASPNTRRRISAVHRGSLQLSPSKPPWTEARGTDR